MTVISRFDRVVILTEGCVEDINPTPDGYEYHVRDEYGHHRVVDEARLRPAAEVLTVTEKEEEEKEEEEEDDEVGPAEDLAA